MTWVWRLGHEHDILNHAPPNISVHFWIKPLLYYIQSTRSRQNKPCPLFSSFNILFHSEVRHTTEVKTDTYFRFTRTLSTVYFICIFDFYFMFIHLINNLIKTIPYILYISFNEVKFCCAIKIDIKLSVERFHRYSLPLVNFDNNIVKFQYIAQHTYSKTIHCINKSPGSKNGKKLRVGNTKTHGGHGVCVFAGRCSGRYLRWMLEDW